MDTLMLAAYILVWPFLSLAVLVLIVTATMKELRVAREEGRDAL